MTSTRKFFYPLLAGLVANSLILMLTTSVGAQSAPSNFTTVVNVPPETAPSSIGTSTQLNLSDGGVIGSSFQAGNRDGSSNNVEVNISGGIVGDEFTATGSVVNVSGGTLADFFPQNGSVFNISGGTLGEDFSAAGPGSEVNISGGKIDTYFIASGGSVVNFSGGKIGGGGFGIRAKKGSFFNISGGTIGHNFTGEGGSNVTLRGGKVGADFSVFGNTEIIGGEYQLNGVDFLGTTIGLSDGDVFTGTLEDGTPFVFSPLASDRLRNVMLTTAVLPTKDTTPIVINNTSGPGPAGLRASQSLTLQSGGALGENFAVVGGVLNIEGGIVGSGVEVVGGVVNITGGDVGGDIRANNRFNVYAGSEVNIGGGKITGAFYAFAESEVNINEGTLSDFFAQSGSIVSVGGGRLTHGLTARSGSSVTVTGGVVDNPGDIGAYSFIAKEGSVAELRGGRYGKGFIAATGSVELVGGEFKLNGVDYAPGNISLEVGDTFTGTLADGSVYIFSGAVGDFLSGVSLSRVPLPVADTSLIVVEATSATLPDGLRPGQSLIIRNQGRLGDNLAAVEALVTLNGGTIGQGFEAYETQVDINAGRIGNGFTAYSGTIVNVTGGRVGRTFALSGSELNINGGHFENGLEASGDTLVNISGGFFENGGWFEGSIDAGLGSVLNIRGGSFGTGFAALSGSTINLFGTEFLINGTPITSLVPGESFTILDRSFFDGNQEIVLSGILEDGSSFSFALNSRSQSQSPFFSSGATLTVTPSAIPEPSALLLASIASCLAFVRSRQCRDRSLVRIA